MAKQFGPVSPELANTIYESILFASALSPYFTEQVLDLLSIFPLVTLETSWKMKHSLKEIYRSRLDLDLLRTRSTRVMGYVKITLDT